TIKKLLRESIDVIDKGSQQVVTNHVLKLKRADAAEVANTIRELYRQVMDVSPLPGQRGSGAYTFAMAIGGPHIGRPVGVQGNPKAAALTVSVEERTNSLLIQTTELLWGDVKKLAEDIDQAWMDEAKNPHRRVQVRRLANLEPTMMQQLVDSMQGR